MNTFLIFLFFITILYYLKPIILSLNILRPSRSLSKRGECLLVEMSQVSMNISQFKKLSPENNYKYFLELALTLQELNQKYGAPILQIWAELRRNLIIDLSFQKKVESLIRQGIAQILIMTAFLFLFAGLFTHITESEYSPLIWLKLISLITLCWVVFFIGLHLIQKRIMSSSLKVARVLTKLDAFLKVGLPSIEILNLSQSHLIYELEDKCFEVLKNQYCMTIDAWRKDGIPIVTKVEDFKKEFWFTMEFKLEKLLKKVQALLLFCSFTFILPAFFLLVSSSFNTLSFD